MKHEKLRMQAHRLSFVILIMAFFGCQNNFAPPPYDTEFDIPKTEAFATALSTYNIYEGSPSQLTPAADVYEYELSSALFTDHAHKQRLIKLPQNTVATYADGRVIFPDGTLIAKTFYYLEDERDEASSKRLIETRLLVKRERLWNVATYVWNDDQTEATLRLDGAQTSISWLNESGIEQTIEYAVPHEGECVTCHQLGGKSTYIGPTIDNLNRLVVRDNQTVNQLEHLASHGVLESAENSPRTVPNYADTTQRLEDRARAYLDINCAHCHQPDAWPESAGLGLDFRFQTSLSESGIRQNLRSVRRMLNSGQMPYLGTTVKDEAGVSLVLQYLSTF